MGPVGTHPQGPFLHHYETYHGDPAHNRVQQGELNAFCHKASTTKKISQVQGYVTGPISP